MMVWPLAAVVLTLGGVGPATAIQLWKTPGSIPTTVPAACRAVLVQNITCANSLVTPAQISSGLSLFGIEATQYCTSDCYNSLRTFQTNVDAKCGNTMYAMYVNSTATQSGAQIADGLAWAYNVSCITDTTGAPCLSSLYAGNQTACSVCALKYGAAMLSSDYGRQRVSPAAFSSQLSSCGVNSASYPYNYTSTTSTTTATTTQAAAPTCTGQTYTVKASDTCESISQANGVGTDLMITRNYLDYNCTTLTTGMSLCLQDTCTITTLGQNETCTQILSGEKFSVLQLVSWNPTIHSNCDNLGNMIGRSICLSPPGGGIFNDTSSVYIPPIATLTSSMFSSWTSVTPAANPTNFTTSWYTPTLGPTQTATSTFVYNATLASQLAQVTQYCWLNDTDFEQGFDEESYPLGCQNLMDTYCFGNPNGPLPTKPSAIPAVCTPNRATYYTPGTVTTKAPAATPTPYQPNMVTGCTNFVFVESGNTCSSIATAAGITLAQASGSLN